MRRNQNRVVWTVVYPDQHDITGMSVAHFEDGNNAKAFALAHRAISLQEESVPTRIADRWTFTRWSR
jgi:hypothetical protein